MFTRLRLRPVSRARMSELARESFPLETGGVLLGFDQGEQVEVTHVIGPGPKAKHHRFNFSPDADWQEAEIARFYAGSGRTLAYVGEWHSHPQGKAWPSPRDRRTLGAIAQYEAARCPDPVMVILAGGPKTWEGAAFFLLERERGSRVPAIREAALIDF